jgi:SAM-dependent methyltransferase
MTDLESIKRGQQQAWAAGDFSIIATQQLIVGELLCEAVDIHPGQRVLDVATGSGNTALAAARRGGEVTGIDFVPALLQRGRERAAAERLTITFQEGTAEALAFPDAAFDTVLSTFGAMFAPEQEKVARELLRVCRPGGKIGMANWTPDGLIGQVFQTRAQFVPAPPGIRPPTLWGTMGRLRELFGGDVVSLQVTERSTMIRHRSVERWAEFNRKYLGPMATAFETLEPSGQEALARALTDLMRRGNRSGDGTLVAPSAYLEVMATRT